METVHKEISAEDTCIEREMEFTPAYRWQHWIRALSIVVLTVTGFYIADPFVAPIPNSEPTNFMQALFRGWHEIFGFVLIAVVVFKSYLFVFAKRYRDEIGSIKDFINPKTWIKQIGYYLLVSKHPHLKGTYNPLQFIAYLGFYMLMFILILTGLILYVHVYHEGLGALLYESMRSFEVMLGGLAWVRELHHIAMWGVIIFVVVHVYMAIFNAVFGKEGSMDAIFSGMKWHKKH
ncbi:Ni/Fe-hydrogenase, b-type cytochrome subunit [Sulfurovum sp. ST-21]|uniref:Ni/Fe-hydrogenase, b-type cytochrome subunit n=1 Tax=Sulfurovum indicum TaxID=2779528 RepID=A0A7M1S330_9BACT|nr:Ni/Fe-hydrogenase, b-type cytochrome subunit [Sulfurovum indicum]QOR61149.1 Ni/Fe-hydrogenase, b-type cytochrome subunit [Sulfurovum indicum]